MEFYSDFECKKILTPKTKLTSPNIGYTKNYLTPKHSPIYSTKNIITGLNGGPLDLSNIVAHNQNPITLNNLKSNFPNFEFSKYSMKPFSYVKAYAANTNQGTIR